MSGFSSRFLDFLRKPEYTGENRCFPCTALNVALALGGSLLVALVSVEGALAVALGALVSIYFRGYLIPGTPTITKRHLPHRVATWFSTHPLEATSTHEPKWETLAKVEQEREHAVEPEQFLTDVAVIKLCDDGDDLCLTDQFANEVGQSIEAYRDDPHQAELIAEMFDAEPGEIEPLERDYPAIKIKFRVRKWPSNGALITDIATHAALAERTGRWVGIPFEQRRRILEALRGFHETCPICAGDIIYQDEVVTSCCGQYQVKRVACVDCDERLLEFDPAKVGSVANLKGFTS